MQRYGFVWLMLLLATGGCALVEPAKNLAVKAVQTAVKDLKQTGVDVIGILKDTALDEVK